MLKITNPISPYSRVLEWNPPPDRGFLTLPRAGANGVGWGSPFEDEEGDPIDPGTSGSNLQNNWMFGPQLDKETLEEVYRTWNSASFQLAGNIDWWATLTEGEPPYRISWNGPRVRYFQDPGYSYDENPLAGHIYQGGSVLAIAPKPVLGACRGMYTVSVAPAELYLVAICKNGNQDQFFRRKWTSLKPVTEVLLTPEEIADQKLVASEAKPDGWELFATLNASAYHDPDTPWFFDNTGSEARCMRGWDQTATGDVTVEHKGYVQLRVTVDGDGIVFTEDDANANLGWTLTEDRVLKRNPDYDENPGTPGLDVWRQDKYYNETLLTGQAVIGVDYVQDGAGGGKWEELTVFAVAQRYIKQEWATGIGTNNDYAAATDPTDIHNFQLGPPGNPNPNNTEDDIWPHSSITLVSTCKLFTSQDEFSELSIEIYKDQGGTIEQWFLQEWNPNNTYFYFLGKWHKMLTYLDLRTWPTHVHSLDQYAQIFLGEVWHPDAPPAANFEEWRRNATQDQMFYATYYSLGEADYIASNALFGTEVFRVQDVKNDDIFVGEFTNPNNGQPGFKFDDYGWKLWGWTTDEMLAWASGFTEGQEFTGQFSYQAKNILMLDVNMTLQGETSIFSGFAKTFYENGDVHDQERTIFPFYLPLIDNLTYPKLYQDEAETVEAERHQGGQGVLDRQYPEHSGYMFGDDGYLMYSFTFLAQDGSGLKVYNNITNGSIAYDPTEMFGFGADRFGPIFRL